MCSLAKCSHVRPTKVLMSGECEDALPFDQTVEDTVVVGKARHEIALQLLLESHENEDGAQELLSLYLIVASEQELVVQVIADACPCPHISAITHPYHRTQPSTFS